MSSNTWTKKGAELLKNLNYYRNSVLCMREILSVQEDEDLADQLRQTERMISSVEQALKMMTDEDLYFLDNFFIRQGERPVDDIMAECIMEKSNVYRLRKRAIERFTMAMYGRI